MIELECRDCGWKGEEPWNAYPEIPDVRDRMNPGEVVPSGDCPTCGALVYEVDAEDSRTLLSVGCPKCGSRAIGERDVVPALALVDGVWEDNDGVEFGGGSEVDWNSQRSANKPAEFECLDCGDGPFTLEQIKIKIKGESNGDHQ